MAIIHCTAKISENGSLTIPLEKIEELGLKPGDEIDIRLQPHEPEELESDPGSEPQSLADLLRDFIGSVHGSGENISEISGEKFADGMERKRQEDH